MNADKITVKRGTTDGKVGVLASWSFGAIEVPIDVIDAFWDKQNVLDDYLKPKAPSAGDAYMNTCSAENIAIWNEIDEDTVTNFEKKYGQKVRVQYITLPTKDRSNEYILARRIWVLSEDETEITPEHPNVARLKFDNQNDRIEVVPFPAFAKSKVVEVITKIANDEYQRQKKVVNGTRHRQAMYRLISEVNGVPYGYGQGTAFIPNKGEDKLRMFRDYVVNVANGYGTTAHRCGFMTTTVIDSDEERRNIAESVKNEVQKQYDKLLDDTVKLLANKTGELSDKAQASIEKRIEERMADVGRLNAMKEDYEKILGEKIVIEQLAVTLPDNVSGRVSAMVMQMAESVSAGSD